MAQHSPGLFKRINVPRPSVEDLRSGEVLLRVTAGGICGSDGPYLKGATSPFPTRADSGLFRAAGFPLHEVVGEVLASRHPGVPLGSHVVGWAEAFDGLAELVVTRGDSLGPFDPNLLPEAAVLIQPLACVMYAVERLGDIRGRSCAVLGLGPIGMLFAHVLASRGAARVVGIDPVDRRKLAAQFGLDHVVVENGATWAANIDDADRPEIVVEAVGHQVGTLQDAISAVAATGTVFYFGVHDFPIYPIDMERMVRKHLTLMAGGTLDRPRMLAEAGNYLSQHPGLVDASITHVFNASDAQSAYDCALRPAPDRLKIAIRFAGTS